MAAPVAPSAASAPAFGWEPPRAQALAGGRLHLSQGPIDLVIRAYGAEEAVRAAHAAAERRFATILGELCAELPALRRPLGEGDEPASPVGRRMAAACRPFRGIFLTPMAAVAGAVADEVLAAMVAAAPLERAFVNNGGDIALHLAEGQELRIAVAALPPAGGGGAPAMPATVTIRAGDPVRGIATSGAGGRSFSLGIADAATILAANAAAADAAATLVANAVDLDHPGIVRVPARELDPDSDLGDRKVTQAVPPLPDEAVAAALANGAALAERLVARGLIEAAFLALQGRTRSSQRQGAGRAPYPALAKRRGG